MKLQKYFAVRVTLTWEDGSTTTRDYVRGEIRMSRERFSAFALGDLIYLCSDGSGPTSWEVSEISPGQVYERRQELAGLSG